MLTLTQRIASGEIEVTFAEQLYRDARVTLIEEHYSDGTCIYATYQTNGGNLILLAETEPQPSVVPAPKEPHETVYDGIAALFAEIMAERRASGLSV